MTLTKCRECGHEVSTEAAACTNCSARPEPGGLLTPPVHDSDSVTVAKSSARLGKEQMLSVVILTVLVASIWLFNKCSTQTNSPASVADSPVPSKSEIPTPRIPRPIEPTLPAISEPKSQTRLISIIATSLDEAKIVENEMQLGGVKSRRDQKLCDPAPILAVRDWVGTIDKLDSNSDGKGVLSISLGYATLLTTWNNELSDFMDHTLLEPTSHVFETASHLKIQERVVFSGTFFMGSGGDCLKEASLTLRGKVEEPEFIFRFADIASYKDVQRARAKLGSIGIAQQKPIQP